MANKPIKRFAAGNGIRASIRENQSKRNGSWHSVTITRTYRDGDEYKDTTSFRRDDMLFVAKVSEMAFEWCLRQPQAGKQTDTSNLPFIDKTCRSWLLHRRTRHSRKPFAVSELIE